MHTLIHGYLTYQLVWMDLDCQPDWLFDFSKSVAVGWWGISKFWQHRQLQGPVLTLGDNISVALVPSSVSSRSSSTPSSTSSPSIDAVISVLSSIEVKSGSVDGPASSAAAWCLLLVKAAADKQLRAGYLYQLMKLEWKMTLCFSVTLWWFSFKLIQWRNLIAERLLG